MTDEGDRDRAAGALATVTSTTLLEGLKDPGNQTIWVQFVDRYRPMILRYAQRLGLAADDAEDVAQASLMSFCQAYREMKYERERGRLREWLFGIVHNQVRNWRRRRQDQEPQASETQAGRIESREDMERLWEEEWRDSVARECLDQVRREVQGPTFRAFEMFALQGMAAEDVAAELDLTPNAVYGAKRRVLRRIRELRPFMEDVW